MTKCRCDKLLGLGEEFIKPAEDDTRETMCYTKFQFSHCISDKLKIIR